jgi:hypothetical protein
MSKSKDTPGQRDTETKQPGGHRSFTAHYAPGQKRPVGTYAAIAGGYGALTAGSVLALRARGRQLPEHVTVADLLLLGVATHRLSRLIAKDKVTSFVRAPFTKFQETSGQGEVEEEAYGEGLRFAIGELLICPYCLGQWVATGLTLSLVAAPRFTRAVSAVFVLTAISDLLQIAYRLVEDQL